MVDESALDGIDNDGDGFIDAADPIDEACIFAP
jgi:hypothetical protein